MVAVRSVMKRKVVRISADDTLWIVKEIMDLAHVRHLPVVHKGELVGVVSQRDLMRASLSNVMGISVEEQKIFLEGVKIAEVMSAPPRTVSASDSVQKAASTMAQFKIGCLPVMDDKDIVGIVTETDLLHYFASQPER